MSDILTVSELLNRAPGGINVAIGGELYHGEGKNGKDFWSLSSDRDTKMFIKFWADAPEIALKAKEQVVIYPGASHGKPNVSIGEWKGTNSLNINRGYKLEYVGSAPTYHPDKEPTQEVSVNVKTLTQGIGGKNPVAETEQIIDYWVLVYRACKNRDRELDLTPDQFQVMVSSVNITGTRADLHRQMEMQSSSGGTQAPSGRQEGNDMPVHECEEPPF